MKRIPYLFATTFLCFSFLSTYTNTSQEEILTSILPTNDTVKVAFGFSLINITDVNEREETIDFDAAIYMQWKDPRLAYQINSMDSMAVNDTIDYSRTPNVIYQG